MNFFKRALTSIIRTPIKSFILFLLIFVLGSSISGALAVRNAIQTTDLNLRRNMRPVVVLSEEWDQLSLDVRDEAYTNFPRSDLFNHFYAVAQLPYVDYFDYSMWATMGTFDLDPWHPVSAETITDAHAGHIFDLRGVSHSEFIDVRQGFIEMAVGETFTETQLESGEHVIVISRYLAEYNELVVGDRISLHINSGRIDEEGEFFLDPYSAYEFEIIGLFDVTGIEEMEFESDIFNRPLYHERMVATANQIYLPNDIVRYVNETIQYQGARFDESLGNEINWDTWYVFHLVNPILVLHDPLHLDDFREAAQSILGPAWYISDGSHRFEPISATMETMRGLANSIVVGTTMASLAVLGLLITLFLYDRRHEIGIYLALGEKKSKIISQILTEIFIIAAFSISTSLLTGILVANQLSQGLLQNEISGIETPSRYVITSEFIEPLEWMGHAPPMSGEEMLAFYDTTLSGMTIVIFGIASLIIVTLSTIVPIIYLTRLSPKKVLM